MVVYMSRVQFCPNLSRTVAIAGIIKTEHHAPSEDDNAPPPEAVWIFRMGLTLCRKSTEYHIRC